MHGLATAAVTSNLMRLDAATAASALSIATDMGTGLLAQAPMQHVVLRTPLGGSLGVYAAGIAREGIAGRLDVLPTFCGIYGDYDPQALLKGLGKAFQFEESGFLPKVFHFSTGIYPTICGIQNRQAARKVAPADIVAIECEASPAAQPGCRCAAPGRTGHADPGTRPGGTTEPGRGGRSNRDPTDAA